MGPLFLTLIGIIFLFVIFLIFKEFINKKNKSKFCVICLAVSLTWIVLLFLYFRGIFLDEILIAILMGQTVLGLFYFFNEKLNVFKLPFLLTLTAIVYFVLEGFEMNASFLLIGLWIFFSLVYLFKSNKKFNVFANKLVECCKKW